MNERDEFWKGDFGNEYNRRSPGDVEANYHLFKRIFAERRVESVVELGAGTGANLRALHRVKPEAVLHAVEINDEAAHALFMHRAELRREGQHLPGAHAPRAWRAAARGDGEHLPPDADRAGEHRQPRALRHHDRDEPEERAREAEPPRAHHGGRHQLARARGIFTTPFRAAHATGIPLLFYGENPQNQYGGPMEALEAQR
jgi:hypothetical protein